ncbi:P-loop containing nucleoside triphosphate hydrolase protein [Zopfochytrium polystomum]|nr:P-loop containing nucleoside triphosphate hydrolase protein [Zopfochytrium polystomum]
MVTSQVFFSLGYFFRFGLFTGWSFSLVATVSMSSITFRNASVVRLGVGGQDLKRVISPFSWKLTKPPPPGEALELWAVVGDVGAGKSTLGQAIGQIYPHRLHPPSSVSYCVLNGLSRKTWDDDKSQTISSTQALTGIRLIGFHDQRLGLFTASTLQHRYHSYTDPDELLVWEYLTGKRRRPPPPMWTRQQNDHEGIGLQIGGQDGLAEGRAAVDLALLEHGRSEGEWIKKWKLEELLMLPLVRLSNGQMRRTRLAREIFFRDAARLLVLDEPFTGLDVGTRQSISSDLGDLAADSTFANVVLLLRSQEPLPDWITHVAELEAGEMVWKGRAYDYIGRRRPTARVQPKQATLARVDLSSQQKTPLVELRNVSVKTVEGTPILSNVWWTIRAGDRWHLRGPNGSGKTTLLSMLTGDHPQAYSNHVKLFGEQRGVEREADGTTAAAEGADRLVAVRRSTVFEIRERVASVSPESHQHFVYRLRRRQQELMGTSGGLSQRGPTLLDVVQGRDSTTVFGDASQDDNEVEAAGHALLMELGIPPDRHSQPFLTAASGEQRLVLIGRELPWWRKEGGASVSPNGATDVGGRRKQPPATSGGGSRSDSATTTTWTKRMRPPRVVILDEPFQGMDGGAVERIHAFLERRLTDDQALVLVTHYVEEVPNFLDRVFDLGDCSQRKIV